MDDARLFGCGGERGKSRLVDGFQRVDASPDVCERLLVLLESPLLPLLSNCAVSVSEMEGPRKEWALLAEECTPSRGGGDAFVPVVRVALGESGKQLDALDLQAAANAVLHARKRARISSLLAGVTRKCSVLLQNRFQHWSLQRQVEALERLTAFVDELMPDGKTRNTRLVVRFGSDDISKVALASDGSLELPPNFSVEEIKRTLQIQ